MSQNQMTKKEKKSTYGKSPDLNLNLDGYAGPQAEGTKAFAELIAASSQARGAALVFEDLTQIFNDSDPTKLHAFGASTAYQLYASSDDSVRRRTAKALSDTEGAVAYNKRVAELSPSNGLVPIIVTAILAKIVAHNVGVAQTATPENENPSKEEEIRDTIVDFIAMKLAMRYGY